MGKGGKRAKKRAIVAVARKLAVLLHHLWATGEVYDPQYNRKAAEAKAKGQREGSGIGIWNSSLERNGDSARYAKAPGWGDCEVAADCREPGNWDPTDRYRDSSTPSIENTNGHRGHGRNRVRMEAWRYYGRARQSGRRAVPTKRMAYQGERGKWRVGQRAEARMRRCLKLRQGASPLRPRPPFPRATVSRTEGICQGFASRAQNARP